MHADGFTLNAKRTPTKENDIPDIINRWQHLDDEADRKRTDQSFMVPVEEIRHNDFDLSFNRYREVVRQQVVHKDPAEVLATINQLEQQFTQGMEQLKEMLND